ncbi:MAG: hypothetical protein AAGG53_03060 [Cyanobacteria bacterium P01_H01_bin.152]
MREFIFNSGGSEIARITKTIEAGGGIGRMRFQATYWNAMSISGSAIEEGTFVRSINRVGNTWYVTEAGQSPAEHAA